MAVQTLRVIVCDKCGTDELTHRFTVGFPTGSRRTFDLCGLCSAPLAALGELTVASGRGPKSTKQPVLTIEEVEARRRRGPKKAAARR